MTNKIVLRDYQNKAVQDIRVAFRAGHKRVILVLSTGAGKCLAKDTPVLMFNGEIKLVQDVRVGDLLMGPDSTPRRVESLARGKEMMYKITPNKGDSYVVNESHILSLKITGLGNKRLTAPDGTSVCSGDIHNLTVKDYLQSTKTFKHCAKGWKAAVDFNSDINLPLPPYILGLWLGDGRTGNLMVTTSDGEIADEFIKYAHSVGMTARVEHNSPSSVNLYLKSSSGVRYGRAGSPFGNALRGLGIFNEKRIPISYKTSSRADRLELLAGLMDTDGHYDTKGFAFTQKSEKLLDDVIFIARSLGFACYKKKVIKKCHNTGAIGEYYSCNICGDIDEIPCRLERKKPSARRINKDPLVTGINVSPVGVGDYYGFEISGTDRLFLLGDFTVTHNTIVFSHIAQSAAQRGNKVLILAHRDQLIKQASRKLRDNGLRHGIIMAGFTPDHTAKVQVASVQTLVRRLKSLKFIPDMIVVDECHLSAAKSYVTILEHFTDAIVLGVTGSPCRLDNKPLGRQYGGLYDFMVTGITIRDLIDRGFLVRPVAYAPAEQIDLSGLKKSMGDFDTTELAAVVDKPKSIGDAVDQYQKICPDVPAVAWCVTVQHAQHVADEFNARGIKAVMLCGEHDSGFRDDTLAQLASGAIKVVTFVGILVEGVDVPEIGAVLLLRPTMSLASYLQVVGRGLRPAPGKNCCYVLDHAGLSFKHGLVDEIRDWSLDWGEKKKAGKAKAKEETVDVIQCGKCFAAFSPAAGKLHADKLTMDGNNPSGHTCCCPNCDKPVIREARKVDSAEGELQEITPEMAERMRRQKRTEVGSAKSLEDLLRIAAQRGYSSGWAQHIYNSRLRKQEKQQEAILAERINKMITVFAKWLVSIEMLERYLGHSVDLVNEAELDSLTIVFNKIKTGTPVVELFPPVTGDQLVF